MPPCIYGTEKNTDICDWSFFWPDYRTLDFGHRLQLPIHADESRDGVIQPTNTPGPCGRILDQPHRRATQDRLKEVTDYITDNARRDYNNDAISSGNKTGIRLSIFRHETRVKLPQAFKKHFELIHRRKNRHPTQNIMSVFSITTDRIVRVIKTCSGG